MLAQPTRRHLLFIGDGSLQMTAQELSTILRNGLKPVIFVINNGGYTIERGILGAESAYNDIHSWSYQALPQIFSPPSAFLSLKVRTVAELETALGMASNSDCFTLAELLMDKLDAPASLLRMGPCIAEFDFGCS